MEAFKNLTYDNTPTFTLKGKNYDCKVLDIYDGDTITVAYYLEGFDYVKSNIRLMGIDTPEMKGEQRNMGIKARNHLIKLLTNINIDKEYTRKEIRQLINNSNENIINVLFLDFDKYGRPLATLYKNGNNINESLVKDGYAKKYDGGKKEQW